jgi:hypothetical protein
LKAITLIPALLLMGCINITKQTSLSPRMVYPNAIYQSSQTLVMIRPEQENYFKYAAGDPFLTGEVTAVEYSYYDTMSDVEAYYESLLPSLGWHKVRAMHPLEKTFCGGDWVGVYRKGSMTFKIHACGARRLEAEIIAHGIGNNLTYYFLPDTTPESILGANYRGTNLTMRSSELPSANAAGNRSP